MSHRRAELKKLREVGLSNRRAESASFEKYPRGRDLPLSNAATGLQPTDLHVDDVTPRWTSVSLHLSECCFESKAAWAPERSCKFRFPRIKLRRQLRNDFRFVRCDVASFAYVAGQVMEFWF